MSEIFEFPIRREGGLARIDLGRPEEGNTLTRPMLAELGRLIARLGEDADVRVVVIEGRGAAFCKGRDGRGESAAGMSPLDMKTKLYGATLGVYKAVAECAVPVVALVHGDAIGFGSALAGACDITIAADGARFALPEIEHGIPPTLAISGVMSKVPAKALSWLVYSAETIGADEARAIGLVSTIYPVGEFVGRSETFLARLAGRPRIVLETIKRYQTRAQGMPLEMATDLAGSMMALARTHK